MSDFDNSTNDLDHSRQLDVHKSSKHPEVRSLVDRIYDDHFRTGKQNVQKIHIKTIILDLYVAWCDDPDLKIAFSRNNNSYLAGSRYNELFISRLAIDVVDTLAAAELVYEVHGFLDRETGIGRMSRIWPTETLIEIFQEARFGILDIGNDEGRECIILRDGDGDDIEYEDTPETDRMREVLTRYNELLKTTFVDIPTMETSWIDLYEDAPQPRDRVYLSQSDKFVRRIFNRGSFERGGRHYGGWWQRCPSAAREFIYLDDCPTSEIDYSGFHVALIYAQVGIDYWKEIDVDPYVIERPDFIETDEQCREICKRLLLIGFNALSESKMYSGFRNHADSSQAERQFTNAQLKIVFELLRQKHEAISGYIASDAGIRLQYIDSQITEKIIGHFVDQEIPILAVHDSYIVPDGFEDELRERMESMYSEVTGMEKARMKEVGDRFFQHDLDDANQSNPRTYEMAFKHRYDPPRSERYLHHWNLFREHWGKPERASWVDRAGWANEMG